MKDSHLLFPFRAAHQGALRRIQKFGMSALTPDDVDALVAIAGRTSPSGAVVQAETYLALHQPDLYRDQMLALLIARATRWLAVIRRDEGEEAFRRAAQEWRKEVDNDRRRST